MIKAKIASLKEEIRSIDFADVLYWKRRKDCSREATTEYERRRDRLQEITRELALWEKNAWPFAERLSIR